MPYKKNLGRVKGENGKTYVPVSKQLGNSTLIEWVQTEFPPENPQDTIINTLIPIPKIDKETGILNWEFTTQEPNQNIEPINIKGEPIKTLKYNNLNEIPNNEKKENILYIVENDDEFRVYNYIEKENDFVEIAKNSKHTIELEIDTDDGKEVFEFYGFKNNN